MIERLDAVFDIDAFIQKHNNGNSEAVGSENVFDHSDNVDLVAEDEIMSRKGYITFVIPHFIELFLPLLL